MSDKTKQASFFIQDPFTEEVQGPMSVQDLKQWYAKGAVEGWGVSKSPNGPWTPAAEVKGLATPKATPAANNVSPLTAAADMSFAARNSAVGVAAPTAETTAEPATSTGKGTQLSPASPGESELNRWLNQNWFLMMILGGVGVLATGVSVGNEVVGGIGLWTAIGGVVGHIVRSRFPAVYAKRVMKADGFFAKATPISVGAIASLVVGALVFLGSMAADTTVDTGTAIGRVHNIGLMNSQRNGIFLGGFLMAVGGVLGVLHFYQKRIAAQTPDHADNKVCPQCGETIKRVAVICKHCKSELNTD
jgi:hypothetical protein